LTQLSGGSVLEPVNVVSMDVSPNGLWLLGLDANSLTPTIDEFQINTTTGALTQWNTVYYNGTFTGSIVPSDIKVAPNGNLVFAALGTAGDVVFTLNSAASSGALVSAGQVAEPTVTTDLALAVGPDSSTLYIARSSGGTGNLVTYSVNANGVPTTSLPLTTSPAGAKPFSVVTDTAGANVYVADRTGGKIYGFGSTMNSGTLAVTAQSVSPYTAGTLVTALVVDSSGDYLLAISDGGTPDLAMYPFDKTTPGNLDLPLSVSTGTPEPAGAVAIATTH
jgi:6-phosphogluconolactonase (cycloisomerase 2 family)